MCHQASHPALEWLYRTKSIKNIDRNFSRIAKLKIHQEIVDKWNLISSQIGWCHCRIKLIIPISNTWYKDKKSNIMDFRDQKKTIHCLHVIWLTIHQHDFRQLPWHLPNSLTEVGFLIVTKLAVIALRCVTRNNMISLSKVCHILTNALHNTASLVSQNHRKLSFGVMSIQGERVCVTHTSSCNLQRSWN
mgnify:CR=1 FL=1